MNKEQKLALNKQTIKAIKVQSNIKAGTLCTPPPAPLGVYIKK